MRPTWLDQILIVDNLPETFEANYGNGIVVSEYRGAAEDDELALLGVYLQTLGPLARVQQVEKRNWRKQSCPVVRCWT